MKRKGIYVVIFSHLLLGHSAPAAASLESVLAPVWVGAEAGEPSAATSDDEESSGQSETQNDDLLVEPGFDSLDVLAELERQVAEKLQPAGELRLIPISDLPEIDSAGQMPEIVVVDYPPRLSSSQMFLRFRTLVDGKVVGNHAMKFKAQANAQVWVPNRRLSPGDRLSADDFSIRDVDLARQPKAVPVSRVDLQHYELARAVAPGQPLEWSALTQRSLVRKGALVDVTGNHGLLSISMKGQATRSGALGEYITIRNLESKREFPAEVVDENRVRVHF